MHDSTSVARSELAPIGTLRVALNMSNFLLTATDPVTGQPCGIAADLGRELGQRLGVPVALVPYPNPGELADAATHGAAYATVSPVFATTSKPGYGPPLGLVGLRALVAGTRVPIVALGGVGPDDVGVCLAAGATGVAVMGAVMTAADPGAVVRELLDHEPVG